VNRRVALRAAALAVGVLGAVAALTVYFSTEKPPPCLISGVPKWRPPTDHAVHRFELVVPDRAICFFDMDHGHELVGYLAPRGVAGIANIDVRGASLGLRYRGGHGAVVDLETGRVSYGRQPPPPPSDEIVVGDPARGVKYVTRRGLLGVKIVSSRGSATTLTFPGFAWNPRFGPNPPDHGLVLTPNRAELWVLDAPNNVVHVFDLSREPPIDVKDIRLTMPLIGRESPCASSRCGRIGSLQSSADGRFMYVGDSGDVIDTTKREEIANLEALHQSRLTLEVDWVDGKPEFPGR
jgi:hypothetical protein